MPRDYTKVKHLEPIIFEMKKAGRTNAQIGLEFGLTKAQVKGIVKRFNRRQNADEFGDDEYAESVDAAGGLFAEEETEEAAQYEAEPFEEEEAEAAAQYEAEPFEEEEAEAAAQYEAEPFEEEEAEEAAQYEAEPFEEEEAEEITQYETEADSDAAEASTNAQTAPPASAIKTAPLPRDDAETREKLLASISAEFGPHGKYAAATKAAAPALSAEPRLKPRPAALPELGEIPTGLQTKKQVDVELTRLSSEMEDLEKALKEIDKIWARLEKTRKTLK